MLQASTLVSCYHLIQVINIALIYATLASPCNIPPLSSSSRNITASSGNIQSSSSSIPASSSNIQPSSSNIPSEQPTTLTVPALPRTLTCMKEFYNIWNLDFKPLYDQYMKKYGRIHWVQLYEKKNAKLYAQRYSHVLPWLEYIEQLDEATGNNALNIMAQFAKDNSIPQSVCIKKIFHQIVKPELLLDSRYHGFSSKLGQVLQDANLPTPKPKPKQDHSKRNKQTTQSDDIPMEIDENIFWDVVKQLNYLNNYEEYKHNFGKVRDSLIRKYTKQGVDQLYTMAKNFCNALDCRLVKHNIAGCDKGNDAAALAVSFGKETYHQLLECQESFDTFISYYSDDYRESFVYCFLSN
jgi:hypothetical protein